MEENTGTTDKTTRDNDIPVDTLACIATGGVLVEEFDGKNPTGTKGRKDKTGMPRVEGRKGQGRKPANCGR